MLLRQESGDDIALGAVTGCVGQDGPPTRRSDDASVQRHVVQVEHSVHGPGQARRAVADCAARLGLQEATDDLLLVVSEMVTNAVRHGAPPVRLEFSVDADAVVVSVADGSASLPRTRTADEQDEGGRGMALVDVLTSAHGVWAQPPGKTVWAAVRRRPAGGATSQLG